MRNSNRLRAAWRQATAIFGITALAGALAIGLSGPASAATAHRAGFPRGADDAVFVQTDNTAGNQVVAYHRTGDGTLTLARTYPTGGLGGQLSGSVVDHLASQGSLQYDAPHALLYAVNAGSNTVSVFAVRGQRLFLHQVIGSGGTFPVSVAVHGDLVYVLNALGGGSVQGYRLLFGRLFPIFGSRRALGLDPTATPQFTNTPGQVAFSPDGSQLIVTTKANGNDIDVFRVGASGRLSASPVVNPEPGTVPFAITFDQSGHLVIANAGTNAVATFALSPDGAVTLLGSAGTGQAATCWVAPDGPLLFASNAGSASISGYTSASSGTLTLLGQTATDPGTVDAAATPAGQFLYVQTGSTGTVDEFRVDTAGTLAKIGSVTVAGAVGGEGIAAS
jgi:6-phosphogluconolactonase (cycloisomerase 2 family)